MRNAKDKYTLTYTLTEANPPPRYRREYFSTKKKASEFIKNNRKNIYWKQLTETNPVSGRPKRFLTEEPGEGYVKKVGTLQTHFETGLECLGLVVYEDGVYGPPNPNYDPNEPDIGDNFKNFASYDALNYIGNGDILKFENGEIVGMLRDREMASKDGFRLSFYPQGFAKDEWMKLFATHKVKVTYWTKIK